MTNEELINEYYNKAIALLGQPRLSFLVGAGCSRCAGLPLMENLTEQICNKLDPDGANVADEKIAFGLLKEIKNRYAGIGNVSIEDYLSEIQDINAILSRQIYKGLENPTHSTEHSAYKYIHTQILLTKIKETIVEILGANILSIDTHRKFCKAIHYDLKKGRERTRSPINYFILNYDTLFEDALALEGVSFNDGFVGGATAWWDPKRFGGEEHLLGGNRFLDARVYKLHGSIDWIKPEGKDFPIRIRKSLPTKEIIGLGEPVVIYPASIKYKETQHDPYSQMIMSFRKHVSDTENHVLAIMGYGFNDEHINIEIKDGIRKSHGALSVIVFLGTKELPKTLNEWISDEGISSQILILGKNGIWKNGEQVLISDEDIDWYKFEKITEIISGVK